MAARGVPTTKRRSGLSVSYKQLNDFSSVILYDTVPKKRGRYFEVERIVVRRNIPNGHEYLLKWQGWPFDSCSWEPSENLTDDLLRSYERPPKPTSLRMEMASRDFLNGIQTSLKGKSVAKIYVNMELDVWRFITANKGTPSFHKGHTMYAKEDFNLFETLPGDWYYHLNKHGEGTAIDFPMKARPLVSWSSSRYTVTNGTLQLAPRMPIEKISLAFARRACDINTI